MGAAFLSTFAETEPGVGDLVTHYNNIEDKEIRAEEAISRFISNSEYKYLIFDESYRKMYINKLQKAEEKLKNSVLNPYGDSTSNKIYKQEALNQIRRIIHINQHYQNKIKDLHTEIKHIKSSVK